MFLSNWGKNCPLSNFRLLSFPVSLKNLLCHSYVFDQNFKISFTRETSLGFSVIFILGGKKVGEKKLLAAALFVSDGYTVYILKGLECEQLPLLLSHQLSCSLYKLRFYYQRNVSLPFLIPAHPGPARLTPSLKPAAANSAPSHQPLTPSRGSGQHRRLMLNGAPCSEGAKMFSQSRIIYHRLFSELLGRPH